MQRLLARLKQFKFVDRTFNLNVPTSKHPRIFSCPLSAGHFYHFEMIPDRCPSSGGHRQISAGALQFEVASRPSTRVGTLISRRQNYDRSPIFPFSTPGNRRHIHADLIIGCPAKRAKFSPVLTVVALDPQEIQSHPQGLRARHHPTTRIGR